MERSATTNIQDNAQDPITTNATRQVNKPFLSVRFSTTFSSTSLFPIIPPHSQDLYHPYKNVEKVQLQADALVDCIPRDQTPLR